MFHIFKFFFMLFCILPIEGKSWLLQEEFLSQEIQNFDCHSSSIVETTKGTYYAVWKGGPGEGKSNIDMTKNVGIWASTFENGYWSIPQEIVPAKESVTWNPVLCKTHSEEVLLFYRVGKDPRQSVSFLKRSLDTKEWTQEEMLPAGIVGPTKNKPVLDKTGALIVPSSIAVGKPNEQHKRTACWIEIATDDVRHWTKVGPLEPEDHPFGVIEPTLYFDCNGDLSMLTRDRASKIGDKGYIWKTTYIDREWLPFERTALPNPDAAIDVADLRDGKLLLVYNHSHTSRELLHIAVSIDGGIHWSEPCLLDSGAEFPSAIVGSDGYVHVTYAKTFGVLGQRRIKHVVIDPEEVIKESLENKRRIVKIFF